MKVLVYSSRSYDRTYLEEANQNKHKLQFVDAHLEPNTTVLALNYQVISCFVDDILDRKVLKVLYEGGTPMVALRATGFNNVDLKAAAGMGITIMRVSTYSPYAVAEFAVGMILDLDRKIHRAYTRVREGNFLLKGLMGFDLNGKNIGIIGTGKIGTVLARIMTGFGCHVLAYDVIENPECVKLGVNYVSLAQLLRQSDIVSLHLPLTPESHHLINDETLALIKKGAMLINTSRGALVDTRALLKALKKG
jgi:D-lactate dehydrogenase